MEDCLKSLKKSDRRIKGILQRIKKAMLGHPGNEKADVLVNEGAGSILGGPASAVPPHICQSYQNGHFGDDKWQMGWTRLRLPFPETKMANLARQGQVDWPAEAA